MKENAQGLPLGRIFGIPVRLDWSWFLIFGLLTWSLATSYFPDRYSGWTVDTYWLLGATTAIALFVSVLLHELGHALLAMVYRIPVRRIRLMIFGGLAEMGDEPPGPFSEFAVAIAGPVVSLALAGVLGALWLQTRLLGVAEPLIAFFGYLGMINLMLVGFNLIPGFPLDGGRVLHAILWGLTGKQARATITAGTVGRVIAFGFIGVGALMVFTGDFSNGLWLGLIGFFLQGAANAEMQAARVRLLLTGRTARQLMQPNFITLPGDLTIQQLADARMLGAGLRTLVITGDEGVRGLLGVEHLRRVPPEKWPVTTLAMMMTPVGEREQVGPDTDLFKALQRMELAGLRLLPVQQDGAVLGLLQRDDVLGLVRTLSTLDAQPMRL